MSEATASAFEETRENSEHFCPAAEIEAMEALLKEDATSICGAKLMIYRLARQ